MPSGTVEPTAAEVAAFVDDVLSRLRRGERLPLDLRLRLGVTAEDEAAMRMPDEVDVCLGQPLNG